MMVQMILISKCTFQETFSLLICSKLEMGFSVNFHDKCDVKEVTFTFPSAISHIHLGL